METKKVILKTADHHGEGTYTPFKLESSALNKEVQWIEALVFILIQRVRVWIPLKQIFRNLFFLFSFFTLFFTCVVHIASNIMW